MANTFDAAPEGAHERSTTSLSIADPQVLLERIIDEANKHRGTLREQDGYTIPFREGGSVRIRVEEGGGTPALHFVADGPTVERREHIERTITELSVSQLGAEAGTLTWQPEG
ncbi:hypothetical protein [Ornithinimicrobium pekingense]|uniref:DUF2218 domain-containing protein n=1 Tax=Ornithinimicrobium pekingense TaxID=384677 RepID=A0ABQ2F9W6_9MICO|nr:hypothetical protein [Ornithinimicrobium pekingense]GGK75974.1 hypothetical protein GCM10011509_25710 [Ornithinimicrobium pekingense]